MRKVRRFLTAALLSLVAVALTPLPANAEHAPCLKVTYPVYVVYFCPFE